MALVPPEPSEAEVRADAAVGAAASAAAGAPTEQLSVESSLGLASSVAAVAAAEERRLRAQATMSMYGIKGVSGVAAEQVGPLAGWEPWIASSTRRAVEVCAAA